MECKIVADKLVIELPKKGYSEEVVYKCFYWYGNAYTIDISATEAAFEITIGENGDQAIQNVPDLKERIKRDLIDFKLRHIVNGETKTIRELIVAKAFAHYDTSEDPRTEISDPVGFTPSQ